MNFDTYQARTGATAAVRQKNRAGRAWACLELGGELLEAGSLLVGTVTKSQFRPKGSSWEEYVDKMKDEMGDVLWCIARVADMCGFTLNDAAKANIAKVKVKHAELDTGDSSGGVGGKEDKGSGSVPSKKEKRLPGAKKDITECPSCQNTELARESGCVTCKSCGWSACS